MGISRDETIMTCEGTCGRTIDIQWRDIWSEKYCSKACANGEQPDCWALSDGANECYDLKVAEINYNRGGRIWVEVHCEKCGNTFSGYAERD